MVAGLIVLLTDFGLDDTYVGTMKGVILQINPRASTVDLCHQVAPQNVAAGAFLLATSYRYFAPDAIFVAVVDPGVGSERRAIALKTPHGTFVGPDNGLLGWVARDFGVAVPPDRGVARLTGSDVSGVVLSNASFFLPTISATFHGRDVFAPVAAHLSLGTPLSALGTPLADLVVLPTRRLERMNGAVVGQVVYIDRFGNAITDVSSSDLVGIEHPTIEVAGERIDGISHHYAERTGLLALVSSSDRLEIALHGGSAAARLGLRPGDPVVVRSKTTRYRE